MKRGCVTMGERLDEGRKRLAEKNLGLVHAALHRMGVRKDYEDMYGLGCVALCRAALIWEPEKGPFSTFASHLVEHELINYFRHEQAAGRAGAAMRPFDDGDAAFSREDESFAAAEAAGLTQEMDAALEKLLGAGDAEILRLLLRGVSPARAAERLHISLSAVYKARARAETPLRRWMNE